MSDFSQSHDVFWRKIASADPAVIVRSTGVVYDAGAGVFNVPLLGGEYVVSPAKRQIVNARAPDRAPSFEAKVILVNYLACGQAGTIAGEWVGEQSLPGGAIFFRKTHELPKRALIAAFGDDVARLATACLACGGVLVHAQGDCAAEFAALPRVALRIIYWRDDGEFPPSVSFLFDRGASTFLPLDGLLALVNELVKKLTAAAKKR